MAKKPHALEMRGASCCQRSTYIVRNAKTTSVAAADAETAQAASASLKAGKTYKAKVKATVGSAAKTVTVTVKVSK